MVHTPLSAHLSEGASFPTWQKEHEQAFAKAEEDLPGVISSLPDNFSFVFSISQKGLIAH